MSLFVVFILLAVLLGAGVMLAPAWRSAQPRVALAATFCLGIIMGGAVFYAELFGWHTLVVDYLLFALLAGVVLGGTLSTAQARAEARGERLPDSEQGWPGPEDLAFFALVCAAAALPLLSLPAPLGSQGQLTGLHSLALRDGASFSALLPYAPAERVLVPPGFHALAAYLSQQLAQPIPRVQMSLTAAVFTLLVWLAYDFGAELRDKRLGRALALAMLLGGGLWRSALDGHFSELLALLFLLACLLYALRLLRAFSLADLAAGGLMLGAALYSNLTVSLALLLAFCLLLMLLAAGRFPASGARSRWGVALGLPLVALIGIAPWLLNNLDALLPISASPFRAELSLLRELTLGQGLLLPLALGGIGVGLRAAGMLRAISLFMLLWLLLLLELTVLGISGQLLPPLAAVMNAPNLARHGAILPMCWFGGLMLLHIWEGWLPRALKRRLRRAAYPLLALAAGGLLLLGARFEDALAISQPLLQLPAASISHDDVAAMAWLRENAAADALLKAADGGGWLPVFAERRALDFRAARYFEWDFITGAEAVEAAAADYLFLPSSGAPPPGGRWQLVFAQGAARVYAAAASK